MALFFFDIDDGKYSTTNPEGMEFADRREAGRAAVAALTGIAQDELPDGGDRRFAVVVKDSDGRTIFEAVLEFRSRSFDPT